MLGPGETVKLADGRVMQGYELLLEAVHRQSGPSQGEPQWCSVDSQSSLEMARRQLQAQQSELLQVWTRRCHPLRVFGENTNRLFATLLLGLHRLESAGTVGLAHQAMLEDMLECWQASDVQQLKDQLEAHTLLASIFRLKFFRHDIDMMPPGPHYHLPLLIHACQGPSYELGA